MTRGYQMRRYARRMSGYGLQRVSSVSPDDRLPETAAVVILRWAWRYRSELAPLGVAMIMALAGSVLHATHPHWWRAIALLSAVGAAGPVIAGRHIGLPARGERLYAATTTAAAGGWLAAATTLGPWSSPLPQVLLTAGVLLAVPWWRHRRRRARVRMERILATWSQTAQAVGLARSRVQSAVVDAWGWRARFALARGESGLGTFRGTARAVPTPDDRANRFELRVLDKDPHTDAITWPGPSVSSITEPVDLGPFEDAVPARVLLLRRHAQLGGVSGSGKSGGLNVLMGNLSALNERAGSHPDS